MTCKDCLHYELCYINSRVIANREEIQVGDWIGYDSVLSKNVDRKCNNFTDHSEWVHLPCKVGDKLYRIVDDVGTSKTHYKIQKYTVSGLSIVVNVKDPYNRFEGYRIGRDLFLDRKEARKLLKEMNGAVFT